MYPYLEAEMKEARVTGVELAETIGVTRSTFSLKRRGKYGKNGQHGFTLAEALEIKKRLRSKLSLERLFEWRD